MKTKKQPIVLYLKFKYGTKNAETLPLPPSLLMEFFMKTTKLAALLAASCFSLMASHAQAAFVHQ